MSDLLKRLRGRGWRMTAQRRVVAEVLDGDHVHLTADEVHACILPEGNAGYITEELEAAGLVTPIWLTMAPKIVENLALVGATGSAAVPLALHHALEEGAVAPGRMVMLLAVETSKWAYGGMVVTWTADHSASG